MNIITGLTMFPLQSFGYSWFGSGGAFETGARIFLIGVAVLVLVLILVNVLKNKYKVAALNEAQSAGPKNSPRRFSMAAFRRITRSLGMNREQRKMLDFVFRCDGVTDPVRSVLTPALLDRHFKRAYNLIENYSVSEDELTDKLSVLFSTRNIIETSAGNTTATSTRQIPQNTAAVLTINDVNYPVRVVSSKADALVVEDPMDKTGDPLRVSKGTKVILAFFTKSSKGFTVESRVLGSAETSTGPVLQLVHSAQIKKLSNRRFRRRQTVISTSFYFVDLEETGYKKDKKLVVDKRRFAGNIMDISIGGCSVKTNTPVSPSQKLKIEFTREDRSVVAALGEVLRTDQSGMNTIMHIRFLKVPRRSLNSINAMVYEYSRD